MANRVDLQIKLESILGSRNVYFQPPETLKIKYPGIIYSLGGINTRHADNEIYMKGKYYTVILIHTDPDNEVAEEILTTIPYCNLERTYIKDNLYHYVFEIYF